MLFLFGFGWAKPVPVNLNLLRDRRKGMILVSSAGIITNMLLAFCALFLYRLLSPAPSGIASQLLYYFARINIILAAFNLIPLPPLDGSKILMGFAPPGVQKYLSGLERYGLIIIIALLYLGVLEPVIRFFESVIISVIKLLMP
jgi:Zn-dependent protease